MKKIIVILLALSCNMAGAKAQQALVANTGDPEMDGILKEVDANAKKDMNVFANDVSTKFGVPKDKIKEAVKVMNPGDVYMSAQVASATNKPFDEVTKTFQTHKNKGWGEIAKEMGIKPGSPEFHAMKKSMKSHGNSKGEEHRNSGNEKGHGKGHDKNHGNGKNNVNGSNNANGSDSGNGNSGKEKEKEKK